VKRILTRVRALLPFLFLSSLAAAEVSLLPLSEVRAGDRGAGLTVFEGREIEEFQVEILGVLKNVGPKQSLILAKLSGGPLERTGVLAGMSGSPVYIDGKLAGAVAYSFPFSKEAIAGVRPIEEMIGMLGPGLEKESRPGQKRAGELEKLRRYALGSPAERLLHAASALMPRGPAAPAGEPNLVPIATPVSLAGFSERTIEVFGDELRKLGLRPMQGVGGQGRAPEDELAPLRPGSMISVALIRGDLEVSAAGTVTHIDRDRLYAFGHRFLSSGSTAMPFMRSSVVTLVPNLGASFKIAGSGGHLGAIVDDRSAGVSGRIGVQPEMVPVDLTVASSTGADLPYQFELVNDRFLSPLLLQIALFSAVDATERQVGAGSFVVNGEVRFAGDLPPLRLDNMFAGSTNLPLQLATTAALPLAYVMQNGVGRLDIRSIELEIQSLEKERRLAVDRAWSSKTRLRAGEEVELAAALSAPDGSEVVKKARYRIPEGLDPGPLFVTFADASSLNIYELQGLMLGRGPRQSSRLVEVFNGLRRNDQLYIRLWRPAPAFRLHHEPLPSLPASVQNVLATPAAAGDGVSRAWRSPVEEIALSGDSHVVQGNVTIQVRVTK